MKEIEQTETSHLSQIQAQLGYAASPQSKTFRNGIVDNPEIPMWTENYFIEVYKAHQEIGRC